MAYELTIYEGTNRDLEESVRYVSTVLEAPGAARALVDEYEDKLRLIASNPCLFCGRSRCE